MTWRKFITKIKCLGEGTHELKNEHSVQIYKGCNQFNLYSNGSCIANIIIIDNVEVQYVPVITGTSCWDLSTTKSIDDDLFQLNYIID